MPNEVVEYQRRSMRLKEYDYSNPGAYFVTVVTYHRMNIFGTIDHGIVQMSQIGRIVEKTWLEIPSHFPLATPDAYVIMPNHIHGILIINNHVEATHASPLPTNKRKIQPLGMIVGSFKSSVTKRVHEAGLFTQEKIWQRNYYDHIIRDEDDYCKICEYIEFNPINWEFDHENPAR